MAIPTGRSHTEVIFTIPDAYRLHVFVCRRWEHPVDDYRGALIIAAHDEAEAIATYLKHENETPEGIDVMIGVFATGDARVLYDDEIR